MILVVDDEETLLRNLARYVNGLGYDTRAVSSGREAIVMLEGWDIDLLITDINMPELDGIEILRWLRSRGSPVPVIAMSGGGAFTKEQLLGTAGRVLGHASPPRAPA